VVLANICKVHSSFPTLQRSNALTIDYLEKAYGDRAKLDFILVSQGAHLTVRVLDMFPRK
jgi:hypothetical protein